MDQQDEAQEGESEFLSRVIDPIARDVLSAADPWAAYKAASRYSGALGDEYISLDHGGAFYVAWAELTDLFEMGKTSNEVAYANLREASASWLDRNGVPSSEFIQQWLVRTTERTGSLFKRDGDFWSPYS